MEDSSATIAPTTRRLIPGWGDAVLAVVCVAVVGFYFWRVSGFVSELGNPTPAEAYYNRLVDGFRAGHLHLAVDVPPGLDALPDPYDPRANAEFRGRMFEPGRLHDTSYYRGRIYLYFGVTPAALLFWPYRLITGRYLGHGEAVAVFASIAFLASVGVLRSVHRRCFPEVSPALLGLIALVLGLANGLAPLLGRPDVWEVPISAGVALASVALALLWASMHRVRSAGWLVAAGTCWGLAIGARPSLVLATPALFLLAAGRQREAAPGAARRRALRRDALALLAPLSVLGLGLAAYNLLRFGSVFEFGQSYQLAGDRQTGVDHFALRHLWINFRLYFFSWVERMPQFPFFGNVERVPLPEGHGMIEWPAGMLTNMPVLLFALAVPLVRRPGDAARRALGRFCVGVATVFVIAATTLCLFYGTSTRYQAEFQVWLAWLAGVGMLEIAARTRASAELRVLGGAALAVTALFSGAFGFCRAFQHEGDNWYQRGLARARHGQLSAALAAYETALAWQPDLRGARFQAARTCEALGRLDDAVRHYEALVRLDPNHPAVRSNLGSALHRLHRPTEALPHLQAAVAADPKFPIAHFNLGLVLFELKRLPEAAEALRAAAKWQPDDPDAHYLLSVTLHQLGRREESEAEYQAARRLNPMLPPPGR
jgi:tetratricopeptide (TPR) repeat protein